MKERPILFTGAMVRALLAGDKTQTRRIIKPQPADDIAPATFPNRDSQGWRSSLRHAHGNSTAHFCPYGQPGDRLWVRETWSTHACFDHLPPNECPSSIHYWADGKIKTGKGRPSIHMPRRISRILLEITAVRVERLQDISEADAKAEGIRPDEVRQMWFFGASDDERAAIYRRAAVNPYRYLWESINGVGSWAANPWVWVVEFKRIDEVK